MKLFTILLLASITTLHAADIALTETLQLPECHSIGWVSANVQTKDTKAWNGVLDEAKWGTPSPQQAVGRNWDWKISDEQWREAVKLKGEGKRENVKFDLWIPDGVGVVRGIIVLSGHGSGESVFVNGTLRAMLNATARELQLAVFKFTGNPMQRGFWPKSLLYERLNAFGEKSGHPELEHAPLFLYGHSNGTGFSALFPSTEGHRVWAWISMRPGITFQVYQPGAAQVPGLVIFGEDDHFLARPSKEENLAVVPAMRKNHRALWAFAVEPKTGHGPGEKTWPFVFSFVRQTFLARVPADADARKGPVILNPLSHDTCHLGENWDSAKGGYQTLPIAPLADFKGDKSTASWLVNAAFAADWKAFQRDGEIARAEGVTVTSPLDFQVVQRHSQTEGTIKVRGNLKDASAAAASWQARLVKEDGGGDWQPFAPKLDGNAFSGTLKAKAGGWYRLELRGTVDGKVIATATVPHVGIGELFVVAGQSNSANYGEEKQSTQTGRVAAFDGKQWQLANDPQPGAGGKGGSFMPPLGDELVKQLGVPVGFIACGIGATSVREWLPKGAIFPNPPTLVSRVEQLADGQWASKGAAYEAFIARMKSVGPQGFRAVLWHQGESDANQKDTTRTLPGKLYREYLQKIIRDSRRDIGFEAPWFVAQASYHVPGDEGSDDIRAAQASLWKDGIAFEGPDSDALKGPLRQSQGKGVHFSGPGLREHGAKWAEKLVPWLVSRP